MSKIIWLQLVFVVGIIGMTLFSGIAYTLWIGDKVTIPFGLTVATAALKILILAGIPATYFLNGLGKVKLQMYSSIGLSLFCVPIAIAFVKYSQMGVSGVIWATVVCQIPTALLGIIQYRKILGGTAEGVWNR